MKSCVIPLSPEVRTTREWIGRNARGDHFNKIPWEQSPVTLALYWKQDKGSQPFLVGRYRIDLNCLCDKGLARKYGDGRILLRFYRTDADEIAIGLNKRGPCLTVGAHPLAQEAQQ